MKRTRLGSSVIALTLVLTAAPALAQQITEKSGVKVATDTAATASGRPVNGNGLSIASFNSGEAPSFEALTSGALPRGAT